MWAWTLAIDDTNLQKKKHKNFPATHSHSRTEYILLINEMGVFHCFDTTCTCICVSYQFPPMALTD